MARKYHLLFLLLVSFVSAAQDKSLESLCVKFEKNRFEMTDLNCAEKLLKETADPRQRIKIYEYLGTVYSEIEKYDFSYKYITQGLKEAKKAKDKLGIAALEEDLGNLNFKLNNFETSRKNFHEALQLFSEISNNEGVLRSKGNLALVDLQTGKEENAIRMLTEIINDEKSTSIIKLNSNLNIGNIYLNLKKPSKAIEYYLKSADLNLINSDLKLQIIINQNIAESYIALKAYDKAFEYNKKSEIFLKKVSSNEFNASLYNFYAQIYQAKKEYLLAYENLKKYYYYKELTDNSLNKTKIEKLEILNELENKEKNLLVKEQKIQLLKNQQIIDHLQIALIALLLTVVVIVLVRRIKRQRQKMANLNSQILETEDKLEFSQKKTDKMGLNMINNHDYITLLGENLENILNKTTDSEAKNRIKTLLLELKTFKNITTESAELFQKADSDFIYILEKKHPDLTEEEKKICTLLYLNSKNKDISVTLKLSLRSVENCRYRIRKKMNLDSNTNLSEYIKALKH